jgi:hypothetical protein
VFFHFFEHFLEYETKQYELTDKTYELIGIIAFVILTSSVVLFYLSKWLIILSENFLKQHRERWRSFRRRIVHKWYQVPQLIETVYLPIDREGEWYRSDIEHQIGSSRRIHLRLISAYTMFYEEREKFIYEKLNRLGSGVGAKDVRIQLLDRQSPYFQNRAAWYVDKMQRENAPHRPDSVEHYIQRCIEIENIIKARFPHVKIEFYQREPLWRLHIFDDVLYVSTYYDIDGPEEGHRTTVFRLRRDDGGVENIIYFGLAKEFEALRQEHSTVPPRVS